ncbi:hypothetical protein NP493_1282g00026 [Ridgeia piscesae]|uniref:Fibrinogen C-terminal domain-containing protein n=1 Tax=Ridgeia piscesae TaxID=27915 RepID=A0AAD9K910_RIDPI|nr:hypothetical protein NP493_1282g00026 [Ridgeia piscesae]
MPPKDCVDIQRDGHNVSGVYEVYLDQARKFVKVYCDLESDNGGWLVFQRRQDGSVDFYRNWADYKAGFGDLTGEFWLGNDLLHAVTSQRHYTLRIDLEDFEGASRFAVYQNFAVSSESDNFRVSFGAYSGNAGDSLSHHVGRAFSTRDRDNDNSGFHCSQINKGGWWYVACHLVNLNGLYLHDSPAPDTTGITWHHWHGYHSLKKVSMKLR